MVWINEVSESGSFANDPTVYECDEDAIADALEKWGDTHERVGSDRRYASLYIFDRWVYDAVDEYPDRVARFNSDGDVVIGPC